MSGRVVSEPAPQMLTIITSISLASGENKGQREL